MALKALKQGSDLIGAMCGSIIKQAPCEECVGEVVESEKSASSHLSKRQKGQKETILFLGVDGVTCILDIGSKLRLLCPFLSHFKPKLLSCSTN